MTKISYFRGVHEKNNFKGGLPKKRGLGQLADLRGNLIKKKGGVFLRESWYSNVHYGMQYNVFMIALPVLTNAFSYLESKNNLKVEISSGRNSCKLRELTSCSRKYKFVKKTFLGFTKTCQVKNCIYKKFYKGHSISFVFITLIFSI